VRAEATGGRSSVGFERSRSMSRFFEVVIQGRAQTGKGTRPRVSVLSMLGVDTVRVIDSKQR
jgi:hypothetical protein